MAGLAAFVYVRGYIEAIQAGASSVGLSFTRLVSGTSCYVAEVSGAVALAMGYAAGLYVAAVAMVVMLAFTISGAWLPVVGVSDHQSERRDETEGR